ncbi:hypothetical protein QN362_08555 [Actimicrobium sp. CCC2.4]|uniref:hypothetical protein n=1 Tax=Actimicrobium sp. CCC2.4 TaxID=3048606 RepID=UPI002AC96514|nr:hypothetical protein [Actimicrobium sp. CCC2.4]MEB0135383.1 hypothetical protein [Actimicrobium sp. CCC2.4]WPX32442.1 hypothetical protein RHM62_00930 [Actimicrobium sp. CCC2.4]
MRATFHTLMIWLMLLAIPVQGFAAATMLLCEPVAAMTPADASAGPHDHAAMLAAQSADEPDQPDQPASSGHHTATKCGNCAAFCIGVVMITSTQPALPALDFPSQAVATSTALLTSVIPAHPERPPQVRLA